MGFLEGYTDFKFCFQNSTKCPYNVNKCISGGNICTLKGEKYISLVMGVKSNLKFYILF